MLVVTIEVWPGGDPDRPRRIARIGAANLSDVADVSDYAAVLIIDDELVGVGHIVGHQRDLGPLELVRRVISEAVDEDDVIDPDVRDALTDRLGRR